MANINNAPALYMRGKKWKQENEQRISVADRLLVAIGTTKGLTANDRLLLILLIGQTDDVTKPFHPSATNRIVTKRNRKTGILY